MKKILYLFLVLFIAQNVGFSITSDELSSHEALKQQGFSTSALQMVDLSKAQQDYGSEKKYQRIYGREQKSEKYNVYQAVKLYVDPTQDDGYFGEHQINFTNTWNGDNTKYSSPLKEINSSTVENL